MKEQDYILCGVRDGGSIQHRNHNPYAINTFFSILNFEKLKEVWNKKEMLGNEYIKPGEFNDELSQQTYPFDKSSLYEPYYTFYFWLRRLGYSFLDARMEYDDAITNSVIYKGQTLLYHTWYARSYNINSRHTDLINRVLEDFSDLFTDHPTPEYTYLKNRFFRIQKTLVKLKSRIYFKLKQFNR